MGKKVLFFIFFGLWSSYLGAQAPNWSVNAANFQYSMTITASLNVNGSSLQSTNDKVAAFVGDEIRGVASVVYEANFNKFVAYLSVYANTDGETVSFKLYDSTNNQIVDCPTTLNFSIDANVGGVFQSFSIANPVLSDKAELSDFSFLGITSISTSIQNDNLRIVVPSTTDITNLVPVFEISEGAQFYVDYTKQTSGVSTQNFSSTVRYVLLSENEAVTKTFEVAVQLDSGILPPVVQLSGPSTEWVNSSPITLEMQTNVPISGLEEGDLAITNALVTSITKISDLNYQLKVAPITEGAVLIQLSENTVVNSEDEGNAASNEVTFTFDRQAPYVTSVERKEPAEEITTSSRVNFRVTFNEAVTNVTADEFESIANSTISISKESDSTYTIEVQITSPFEGVVGLTIKSGNSIKDRAGNVLRNAIINMNQN